MITTFKLGPLQGAIILAICVLLAWKSSTMSSSFYEFVSHREEINQKLDAFKFKPPDWYPERVENDKDIYLKGYKEGWYLHLRSLFDPNHILHNKPRIPPYLIPYKFYEEPKDFLSIHELGIFYGYIEADYVSMRITSYEFEPFRTELVRAFAKYLEKTTSENVVAKFYREIPDFYLAD